MAYPLTRRTNRAQLAEWFRLPESVRAFENLQSDVIELFKRSFTDAPRDGKIYGRRDGAWVEGVGALFTATTPGMVPASGFDNRRFLRADGRWTRPLAAGEDTFLQFNDDGEFGATSNSEGTEGLRWLKDSRVLMFDKRTVNDIVAVFARGLSNSNYRFVLRTGQSGSTDGTIIAKLALEHEISGVLSECANIEFRRGDFPLAGNKIRFNIDGAAQLELRSDEVRALTRLYVLPSSASRSTFHLAEGTAPTSPQSGDVWLTASGLFYRANNVTYGPLGVGSDSGGFDINDQTGTSYTLQLTDANTLVRCSNSSPITVTVPPVSSVAFPVGTTVTVRQVGSGQVTLSPGTGVTLNTPETLKTRKQHASIVLVKVASNEWDVGGDLE